jgi:type IV pilus assembly protein PilN
VGGFNLLPYRQRDARRARRRCLIECLAAILAGSAAVAAWAGWEALERARLEARRETLETVLSGFGIPLAEYRRLQSLRADQQRRMGLAQKLAQPRDRLVGLFNALSRQAYPGIVLHQLRQTEHDVTLTASAQDSAASSTWLANLGGVRDVQSVDITDLRHLATSPDNDDPAIGSAIEFAVHLQWDRAVTKPVGDERVRADSGRSGP